MRRGTAVHLLSGGGSDWMGPLNSDAVPCRLRASLSTFANWSLNMGLSPSTAAASTCARVLREAARKSGQAWHSLCRRQRLRLTKRNAKTRLGQTHVPACLPLQSSGL